MRVQSPDALGHKFRVIHAFGVARGSKRAGHGVWVCSGAVDEAIPQTLISTTCGFTARASGGGRLAVCRAWGPDRSPDSSALAFDCIPERTGGFGHGGAAGDRNSRSP